MALLTKERLADALPELCGEKVTEKGRLTGSQGSRKRYSAAGTRRYYWYLTKS